MSSRNKILLKRFFKESCSNIVKTEEPTELVIDKQSLNEKSIVSDVKLVADYEEVSDIKNVESDFVPLEKLNLLGAIIFIIYPYVAFFNGLFF